MNKISTPYKLTIVSLVLLTAHLILNLLINDSISFVAVLSLQLFYSITLFFAVSYIKRGLLKDSERVWVIYLGIVSIKFFVFLGFIFGMKWYFEINKVQALIHVFLWFFIYLFIEVKFILNELQIIKKQ